MKSITELEKRVQCLEKENQYLKHLLADAGIPYSEKIADGSGGEYDPDQGARILPRNITETDAKVFFSMFWGRTDVYSRRTVKKSTGEVNYYTQCHNFWKNGCPRITGSRIKCRDCTKQSYKELKKEQIISHLRGDAEDATDVIGVFPLLPDDTCRFIVFDFDNHEKNAEKNDFANADDLWRDEVDSLRKICGINGIDALAERSRSGRGTHLWIFFQKPVEAGLARKFGNALLVKGIIRNNEDRDELIIRDVKKCVDEGRTPVVLSRYVEHSQRLYQRLAGYADKVFLLSGRNSKKEHKEILCQMNQVAPEESMILVATGRLIGEGFDYPRLDTLVMATPVAWKGVVEQYAGRLNRDYDGKESVVIYDYVDIHISMFDRMYHKRLKAYKQIGYDIFSGEGVQKQTANAIFDITNYAETYRNDLLAAEKEIIISSPTVSGRKVYDMIHLLREKQEAGIKISIVTWKPDSYGYGDSAYWQELQEHMRRAGFEMNLVENYCEHYCMIDREVVWYGSLNFLGKEDAEDNLMRIADAKIAEELLEMTFGDEKYQGETM